MESKKEVILIKIILSLLSILLGFILLNILLHPNEEYSGYGIAPQLLFFLGMGLLILILIALNFLFRDLKIFLIVLLIFWSWVIVNSYEDIYREVKRNEQIEYNKSERLRLDTLELIK